MPVCQRVQVNFDSIISSSRSIRGTRECVRVRERSSSLVTSADSIKDNLSARSEALIDSNTEFSVNSTNDRTLCISVPFNDLSFH